MLSSNFEKPHISIEPEATPEQVTELVHQRDLLSKKLLAIDEALEKLSHKKGENGFEKYQEEQQKLSDTMGTIAHALSQENLQKIYTQEEPATVVTPAQPVPPVETNTYNNYLADNEKLGDIMGDAANALSQENLKKIYSKTEEPKETSVVQPIVVQETVTPQATGAAQAAEAVPEEATPAQKTAAPGSPSVQKTQAELLAEKIRNLDKTGDELTPEDFEFRTKHWPEVSEALEKLQEPIAINENRTLEQGKKSLEWVTSSYGDMLFRNKAAIRNGFDHADPLMRDSLKKLSADYHELHFAEVQKIHESKGSIADQMTFYKQQSEKLALEVMKHETEETKKRVGKAVSKTTAAVGAGLLYLVVFGAKAARATWEKGKDLAGRGLDKAQELWKAPASKAKTLKERLMEKFQMNTEKSEGSSDASKSEKKEPAPLAKKFGKTNQDRIAQRTEVQKKMRELEDRRILEKKTKEAIEKVIGKPLEGDAKTKWERLGKISIGGFFNPTTKLGKKLEDYPEDARALYDKLIPIYQRDLTSDTKMSLGDYVTQLVKEQAI